MTRARLGALLALICLALIAGASGAAAQTIVGPRQAYLFLVPGASLEELLSSDDVRAIARAGGSGFMSPQLGETNLAFADASWSGLNVFVWRFASQQARISRERWLDRIGDRIRSLVPSTPGDRVLVIVASPSASAEMRAAKDELRPIVLADASADRLFHVWRPLHSLTSDSTRRSGVVSDADVRATMLSFLGQPAPEGAPGSPIRIDDAPPPFELHERYLAQRQMYVPVGTAAALYVTGVGLLGIGFLAARRRLPRRWLRAAGWATLSVPMLATGMLATGHLPNLTYATAVPMIAIVTVFGTMALSPLERREPTLVPAGIGVAVLAAAVAEAILGWSGMLSPLLGGTELDGGRFYGLPNVAIGLLVGAALWVAQRLSTLRGFALLCGLGLFAGLPLVGSNLGGAVTAFAAAGLWLAVRERERLGRWRAMGMALGTTVAGTALILLANAISPVATHITRFERSVGGIGAIAERLADRLRVGVDLMARSPAAIVPVVGLPVVLLVVLRPPRALASAFERWPAWRDAVLVTTLAGIVAYLANDSGPAAAGLAFGLGLGGALGVSLLGGGGKMDGSTMEEP